MRTTTRTAATDGLGHQWVAAALVGMGAGGTPRAEHAARTGKHVVPAATRIRVLEVYCSECRAGYTEARSASGCPARRSARGRGNVAVTLPAPAPLALQPPEELGVVVGRDRPARLRATAAP